MFWPYLVEERGVITDSESYRSFKQGAKFKEKTENRLGIERDGMNHGEDRKC